MVTIKTLKGANGTKFQVIMRDSAGKTTSRTFRRLQDAKAWRAAQMTREAPGDPTNSGGTRSQ
jgi:hypothetical protein